MAIVADLKKDASRIFKGGGFVYIVEYDAAKTLLVPHCTVKVAAEATDTELEAYAAATADFGSSGALDIDIFGANPEANLSFTGLAANVFTLDVGGLANDHAVGAIVRLYDADAYAFASLKCFGHLGEEGSHITPNRDVLDVHNEQSEHVQILFGKKTFTFSTTLLQSGKDELDFLLEEAEENYYAMLYAVKLLGAGHQFFLLPRVMIVPSSDFVFGGDVRKLAVSIRVLKDDVSEKYHKLYQG